MENHYNPLNDGKPLNETPQSDCADVPKEDFTYLDKLVSDTRTELEN